MKRTHKDAQSEAEVRADAKPNKRPKHAAAGPELNILDLPIDIYKEIFERIRPAAKCIRCAPWLPAAEVCKSWRLLLKDMGFVPGTVSTDAFVVDSLCQGGRQELECWIRERGYDFTKRGGLLLAAARAGDVPVFRRLQINYKAPWSDDVWALAGEYGNIDLLRSLFLSDRRRMPRDLHKQLAASGSLEAVNILEVRRTLRQHEHEEMAVAAAFAGHVHILKAMRQRDIYCTRGKDVWIAAGSANHHKVLQWLSENMSGFVYEMTIVHEILEAVIKDGGTALTVQEIITYLAPYFRGEPADENHLMMWQRAITRGDIAILDLLAVHHPPRTPAVRDVVCNLFSAQLHSLSVPVLKWIYDSRLFTEIPTETAIKACSMDAIKWLHQTGRFSLNRTTLNLAAKLGAQGVLDWMRFTVPPTADVPRIAMMNEQFHIIHWVRHHDCPWDARTLAAAATLAHWKPYSKWLFKHGCPYDDVRILLAVPLQNRQSDAVHKQLSWTMDHGCPWTMELIEKVMEHCPLPLPILERLDPFCPQVVIEGSGVGATFRRKPEGAAPQSLHEKWRRFSNVSPYTREHLQRAVKNGSTSLLRWLLSSDQRIKVENLTDPDSFLLACVKQQASRASLKILIDAGIFNTLDENDNMKAILVALQVRNTEAFELLCRRSKCPISTEIMHRVLRDLAKDPYMNILVDILHKDGRCPWDDDCLRLALLSSDKKTDMVPWMRAHNCPYSISIYLLYRDAAHRNCRCYGHNRKALWEIWQYCPIPPNQIEKAAPGLYLDMRRGTPIIQDDEEQAFLMGSTELCTSPESRQRCQRLLDLYKQNDGVCRICPKAPESKESDDEEEDDDEEDGERYCKGVCGQEWG